MTDALDRIDRRLKRASVPPRDKSLVSQRTVEQNTFTSNAPEPELNLAKPDEFQEMPEPVATTVRIDKPIFDKLTELCFKRSVTRETFLEAAFLLGEQDAELMSKIVAIASKHCQYRKVAKEERKFQTLLEKRTKRSTRV